MAHRRFIGHRLLWPICLAWLALGASEVGAQASDAAGGDARPAAVELTADDVEGFIAVVGELDGLDTEVEVGTLEPGTGDWAKLNAQALAVIERHGFDVERFQVVAYSISLAAAAGELDQGGAEFDQALAQLEAMKPQLSETQYEAMRKQLVAAAAMLEDQPPGNVALVARYRAELEALGAD